MALPLAHHVDRARSGARRVASHPEHDLLREGDPDLLVVHEIALARQRLDRVESRLRVALRVEDETVALADSPVTLGAELGAGSKEREVDVEEDSLEHRSSIALTFLASRYPFRARGVAQPGSALRSGRRGPQFKSGHPDFTRGRNPQVRIPPALTPTLSAVTYQPRLASPTSPPPAPVRAPIDRLPALHRREAPQYAQSDDCSSRGAGRLTRLGSQ